MKDRTQEIIDLIKSLNIVPPGGTELSPRNTLRDQGIDSLDMMTLFLNIEEKFGIKIPDADIDGLDSIEKISTYLNRNA